MRELGKQTGVPLAPGMTSEQAKPGKGKSNSVIVDASILVTVPVCVARGSEGQAQDWSGGGQICTVAGVPGTQGEDDIETHGFLDFRGISYLHEIVLPGFGNCDGVLRNSRKLLENLNTYCNFYLLQAQPNNFYFKGTFQI